MLVLHGNATKAEPAEIKLVTQSFAPLQWDNDGRPDGYVTAFLLEAAERVNQTVPVTVSAFEFLPWKRAMLMAESVPNVMFFSLSRTPEREDKFLWLDEVSPYGQNFYQLATQPNIEVERIEELRDLNIKIGVQDGSNLLAYLKGLGFEGSGTLVPITDFHQGIEMLYLGRIDLLPLTGFLAEASACKQGYDGSQLRPVIFVEALAKPLWAVFSKGTNPDLVDAFRTEMAALKDEGFLEAQIQEHQANWQTLACGAVTAGK
ncbi:substrate-binding periplasmic protein [Roseibium sediminicola]|uniref:ABC transporter substrate-binding protein n=1 Tax=Roseibium sediminicola TaxID=2933272 RepID=A0ABT0GS90_9HYPH|nr:ABC transporter substrate-binding protein [Roseibium sp. CAU 1639]MCK7612303.1 ABC transporter substrate-binding protein [Roseibium sp. CAU 1639]